MSTQRAVDKWGFSFRLLLPSLSFTFILAFSLFAHTNRERSRFYIVLFLLQSNLVEFSWVDILLSSRAYLYLAFESSGPFARFANCIIALAFCALHEKKRKRKGKIFSLVPDS